MEKELSEVLSYLWDVVLGTLFHLFILFGPVFLLSFIMHQVSKKIEYHSISVMGFKPYMYIFGWLGTATHEIGHAVFCPIFGHKITEIRLFTTEPESGTLGYVNHNYNPNNFYQVIGNFFIGMGPIVFSSLILFLISWLLFGLKINELSSINIIPGSFEGIETIRILLMQIWDGIKNFIHAIFNQGKSQWWKILLYVYLLFSIGSAINLSKPDLSGVLKGFIYIMLILFLFNLATMWAGDFTMQFYFKVSSVLSGFYFLLISSIVINLLFLVIVYSIRKLTRL